MNEMILTGMTRKLSMGEVWNACPICNENIYMEYYDNVWMYKSKGNYLVKYLVNAHTDCILKKGPETISYEQNLEDDNQLTLFDDV